MSNTKDNYTADLVEAMKTAYQLKRSTEASLLKKSMNVSFRIDFKEVTLKGSGLELLTYDSSVGSSGIVKLDCIAGSSQIVKFKTNTAGRIVIRRVASARNFTGIADVYLEKA